MYSWGVLTSGISTQHLSFQSPTISSEPELYQDVQAKLLPLLQVLTDGLGQALEVLLQVDGIVAKSRKKRPNKSFEGKATEYNGGSGKLGDRQIEIF